MVNKVGKIVLLSPLISTRLCTGELQLMRNQLFNLHLKVCDALKDLLALQKKINLQPEPHPSILKEIRFEPMLIDEVLVGLEELRLIEYIKLVDEARRLTRSLRRNLDQGLQEIEYMKRLQCRTAQYGEHLKAARKAINQACQQGKTLSSKFEQLLHKLPDKSAEGVQDNVVFLPTRSLDEYSFYEEGMNKLLQNVYRDNPHYSEILNYENRLRENIDKARRYGDKNSHKVERNEIIHHLNNLTESILGKSFNELCK
jgi:hypothetical protein